MPKSCLLVFPHCERKRQNSRFQIGTFHFRFFFSSLPLRFNISCLPTFHFLQVTWNDVSLVVVVQKQSSSSLAVASGSN